MGIFIIQDEQGSKHRMSLTNIASWYEFYHQVIVILKSPILTTANSFDEIEIYEQSSFVNELKLENDEELYKKAKYRLNKMKNSFEEINGESKIILNIEIEEFDKLYIKSIKGETINLSKYIQQETSQQEVIQKKSRNFKCCNSINNETNEKKINKN